jgi:hypothetical protein
VVVVRHSQDGAEEETPAIKTDTIRTHSSAGALPRGGTCLSQRESNCGAHPPSGGGAMLVLGAGRVVYMTVIYFERNMGAR